MIVCAFPKATDQVANKGCLAGYHLPDTDEGVDWLREATILNEWAPNIAAHDAGSHSPECGLLVVWSETADASRDQGTAGVDDDRLVDRR